ncbi:imidazolonepropionase [Gaetbulibacter aestuarii]|uniref:Imidazolonepropionase n=1 Tax=Gaetbulibacter aestuarii TaxID=1502358 RepID=A0ABW7N080_9FLAO
MKLLVKNIKELLQVRETSTSFLSGKEMAELPTIKNAFLVVEDEMISNFGPMTDCPESIDFDQVEDASGKIVIPTWCDSHTHLVYAGNREREFVDRIHGLTYEEIAKKGGGILNSAKTLQNTSEEDLYQQSKARLKAVMAMGTGAIEIKSGYGLTLEAELKMLRVIKRLKEAFPISVKATFLGAHAVPKNTDKETYVKELIESWIPKIAGENLAEYIDVFCETGYFSVEDTEAILKAGKAYGLKAKIHVNQFTTIGGVAAGVKNDALSVDHLELLLEADIQVLQNSRTMPVALPGCSYFLSIPYTPARKIIDTGLPLALATDYNPGSAPSGNMNFVVSTACVKMGMTPEEAINAATINGAYAMGLENQLGSITKGKFANFMITEPVNSYSFLPYSFGEDHVDSVYIKGHKIE